MSFDCSVIIPTCKRADELRACLDALEFQASSFEVIVVVDGDDIATKELASRYSAKGYQLRWLFLPNNVGCGNARKIGVAHAQSGLLLFLDDDMRFVSQGVSAHIRHHDANDGKERVMCGPISEHYAGPPRSRREQLLRSSRDSILRRSQTAFIQGIKYDEYAYCGANCSVRRNVFLGCGGYDSFFVEVSEEMELGSRLHAKGILFEIATNASAIHLNKGYKDDFVARAGFRTGLADVYRVTHKMERSSQISGLWGAIDGKMLQRWVARKSLHASHAVGVLATASRHLGERKMLGRLARTGLSLDYSHNYWTGVAKSLSFSELKTLAGHHIETLMFHQVVKGQKLENKPYDLSQRRFKKILQKLESASIKILPAEKLAEDPAACGPTVSLTFDDGYAEFFDSVYPVLSERAVPATVFIVAGNIGKTSSWDWQRGVGHRRLLDAVQIREMARAGIAFGAHSMTHAWLPSLTDRELEFEVRGSKEHLENILGSEVKCFAYPSGGVTERVRSAVVTAGFNVAFTAAHGSRRWSDPLSLGRTQISESTNIHVLIEQILQP